MEIRKQMDTQQQNLSTMDKTLLTVNLMDGFWDRWLAHGVDHEDLAKVRSSFLTQETWSKNWEKLARQKLLEGEKLKQKKEWRQAERKFRTAGLYYHLIQWLFPERTEEKIKWLKYSLNAFQKADSLSKIKTQYPQISVDHSPCFGRIRIPSQPVGVVIIVNPIDSTKEELFTYEMDFVDKNFATVSFDGPGQGETYTIGGVKGTKERWQKFVTALIEYTDAQFPNLPIYLFGTSSGASWSIYGSCHPKVSKAVAVSPAFLNENIRLPDYFVERMKAVLEANSDHILPSFDHLTYRNPIMLVHGKQDVMVSDQNIYQLYEQLPVEKWLKEYEEEGHCCNYKLPEIRELAMQWFKKGNEKL